VMTSNPHPTLSLWKGEATDTGTMHNAYERRCKIEELI
jgi:hypothetical protein